MIKAPQTDKISLLVTDSGLGGLSVFADLVQNLEKASPWPEVEMIYFNAWPEEDKGYNHYPDMAHRARVFQNAMEAMAAFSPQKILIACNTLSVVYEHTPFAKAPPIPVTGIVDTGVTMMAKALKAHPEAGVIIFGTPTTAESELHAKALMGHGISPDRIISQGCVNLAGHIERTPFAPRVEEMIFDNARQAAQRAQRPFKKIYLGLCCTHFGYRKEVFSRAVEESMGIESAILNPNEAMARAALPPVTPGAQGAKINLKILTRVTWDTQRISAYQNLFKSFPTVVEALKTHELNSKLFQII